MLILLAESPKMFPKKKISDMKYDVKTSEMMFLLIMSRKCMSKYLHSPTISFDELFWTDEAHKLMNNTRSRGVTRKRRHR